MLKNLNILFRKKFLDQKKCSAKRKAIIMKQFDLLENYMDYLDYWCEKYYRNGFVDSIELLKTI